MQIRIWIGDLHAYNAGRLVGEWVDLPLDEEDLDEVIEKILEEGAKQTGEKGEEYFIADYEFIPEDSDERKVLNSFDVFSIDEYSDPFEVNEFAEELEDLDWEELAKLAFLCSAYGFSISSSKAENLIRSLDDIDFYPGFSLRDLAQEFIEGGIYTAGQIRYCIDVDSLVRDLEIDGYFDELEEEDEDAEVLSYEDKKDMAEDYIDTVWPSDDAPASEVPESFRHYIDLDCLARDLGMDYEETPLGVFRMD